MNTRALTVAAKRVMLLLKDYANPDVGSREMLLDPILYGYFEGRFGTMSRQYRQYLPGRAKPLRIDFRRGSTNPTLIEFAVRPPSGGNQLYGSQNRPELQKLSRVPQSRAKLRILLLIDLAPVPHKKRVLQPTYSNQLLDSEGASPASVRVVYVHAKREYSFLWKPRED